MVENGLPDPAKESKSGTHTQQNPDPGRVLHNDFCVAGQVFRHQFSPVSTCMEVMKKICRSVFRKVVPVPGFASYGKMTSLCSMWCCIHRITLLGTVSMRLCRNLSRPDQAPRISSGPGSTLQKLRDLPAASVSSNQSPGLLFMEIL